jgi:hypothetical protein
MIDHFMYVCIKKFGAEQILTEETFLKNVKDEIPDDMVFDHTLLQFVHVVVHRQR